MSEPDRTGQRAPWAPSAEAHDLIPMAAFAPPPAAPVATGSLDIGQCRAEGLRLATELLAHERNEAGAARDRLAERVIETAGRFSSWLLARPHHLRLTPSRFTFEQGSPGPGTPTTTGENGMSVSMSDTQEVTYAVEAEDSKGFEVADTLTWSSDDGGAVVTVTPAADGMSCTFAAAAPGTATISVTDGTLSASDLITVTPGAAASLVLTPGAVTDQPAPAPAGS